ncbi:MAG: hypothetical protein WCH84_10605 [Verrucomicrobiota bacterium]
MMTTQARMRRILQHREADRVPITDSPWGATLERWRKEGLPANVDWVDYFELDRFADFGVNNSPRYPEQIVEDTTDYRIHTNSW